MRWNSDFKSKLFDGVFSPFLIIIILVGLMGSLFLARVMGIMGFIVYIIIAVLVTGVCLKKSLNNNLSEISKAWFGIVGGMTAWTVIELGEILGLAEIESEIGIHIFILVGIFVWFLWKFFPVGSRFFIFVFLLNWGGHIVIHFQRYLSGFWDIFHLILLIYPWLVLSVSVLIIYWVFKRSKNRIDRLYAAGWLYLFIFTFIYMVFF